MADMKGLKVRVPKNQVMIDTFKEFGAAPIPLPWAERPFISFGLRYQCLKAELHCSAVKRHGQFLKKMNGLMIFFFAFL